MSDYSSYIKRDAFNEAHCSLVEEFLHDKDTYPENTILVANSKLSKK